MFTPARIVGHESRGAVLSNKRVPGCGILTQKPSGFEYPSTKLYAKLPLTPWKPCEACFMTHFRTLESL